LEVRLYAENPANDFLPVTGQLSRFRVPQDLLGVRVDTGVAEGDSIGVHYDPMIAKLIVHGPDRSQAVRKLQQALARLELGGMVTNLDFLRTVIAHPRFIEGGFSTKFLTDHGDEVLAKPDSLPSEVLILAAVSVLLERRDASKNAAARTAEPDSPWSDTSGWRMNLDYRDEIAFTLDGERHAVSVEIPAGAARDKGILYQCTLQSTIGHSVHEVSHCKQSDQRVQALVNGRMMQAVVMFNGHRAEVLTPQARYVLELEIRLEPSHEEEGGSGRITAMMPGKVIHVAVAQGDVVAKDDVLLVLEAMKMEHTIRSPFAGKVTTLNCAAGEQIDADATMLIVEKEEA
jgi:3-methylcrotonyl-CoA carboxylase alpha subunit